MDNILAAHNLLYEHGGELMKKKNHDYRGGSNDPFANFRLSEMFNVPVGVGIKIRICDKHMRIRSFIHSKLLVEDERVMDSLIDCHNYTILLHAWSLGCICFRGLMAIREEAYALALESLDLRDSKYPSALLANCERDLVHKSTPIISLLNGYTNIAYRLSEGYDV